MLHKADGIKSVGLSENVYAVCTNCFKLKPILDFGLRTMSNGTVRNQPQCKECRGK